MDTVISINKSKIFEGEKKEACMAMILNLCQGTELYLRYRFLSVSEDNDIDKSDNCHSDKTYCIIFARILFIIIRQSI